MGEVTQPLGAAPEQYDFVVVSNRLPVDRVTDAEGNSSWTTSPGGLVTALEPVMRKAEGAWVGWAGQPDLELDAVRERGHPHRPGSLERRRRRELLRGLQQRHALAAVPRRHRAARLPPRVVGELRRVNQRFADAAAAVSAPGAVVWVQDYQLQLVPRMLRIARPDLTIGFFNHIPFPPYGIYSQLPWRTQVIEGLLGADVIGFQRVADAGNFSRAVRRLTTTRPRTPAIEVAGRWTTDAARHRTAVPDLDRRASVRGARA